MTPGVERLGRQRTLKQYLEAEARLGTLSSRFLLAAGQPFSVRLFDHDHTLGRQGHCYGNAFALVRDRRELVYCEGRALSGGVVPLEHAWCVDAGGQVVDTTWRGQETDYFGVRFRYEWLAIWLLKRGVYGVLSDHFPLELLRVDPAEYLHQPTALQLEATRNVIAQAKLDLANSRRRSISA